MDNVQATALIRIQARSTLFFHHQQNKMALAGAGVNQKYAEPKTVVLFEPQFSALILHSLHYLFLKYPQISGSMFF